MRTKSWIPHTINPPRLPDTIKWGRVEFIPGNNNGKYPYCHSLYINDELKTLIDPASDQEKLLSLKKDRGVDVIINSHYHEDHFMYNYLFPDADLYVPKADAPCFRSLDSLLEFYGVLGTEVEGRWRKYMLELFNYRERAPSREFGDGDTLTFGTTSMVVIHTPGHTPGHSCFYFKDEEILFLADMDLTPFGPWYGDGSSDLEQTIASINRIKSFQARIFITGHGEGVVQGDVMKKFEGFLQVIARRESALLEFLREPRTMEDIVRKWIVYKKPREPVAFYEFGERGIMKKHLDRLISSGAVMHHNERYWRK